MHPRHEHFVRQAATMAESNADALARGAVAVGRAFHSGEHAVAIDELMELLDRVHKFMSYLVLAEVLLAELDPEAAQALGALEDEICASLDRVERALGDGDLAYLGVELARGLSTALLDYHGLAPRIAWALEFQAAAA